MWRIFVLTLLISVIISACEVSATPAPPRQDTGNMQTQATNPLSTPDLIDDNNIISISKNSLENIPPSDVIQEIGYFGGLGGGCGKMICECEINFYNQPSLFSSASSTELFTDISFEICGAQAGEKVFITVTLPDQTQRKYEDISSINNSRASQYGVSFEYTPIFPDPTGTYLFSFTGDNWNLEKQIEVADTVSPRLFLDKQGRLLFYKFQPNENVRLFAYERGKLLGWTRLTMNQQGMLLANLQFKAEFIAVGNITGQVLDREEGTTSYRWMAAGGNFDIVCDGASNPVGIIPDGYAEITEDKVPIYKFDYGSGKLKNDGFLSNVKGTRVTMFSNAICYDNAFVWNACVNNNCGIYIPERMNNTTYLRPASMGPATVPPTQIHSIPACPGTLPTRLSIGMKAEVTTSGMAPQLSLRAHPSLSAEKVHVIAAGRDMVVLDGPVCADDSYWWYIRSEQGFEGWSREGDHEDYWIDPLP